jgi:flagellar hook protein FlgE
VEIPAFSSALQGISRAEGQLNKAAGDIARASVAPSAVDSVDLSTSMVALLESRNNFAANTKVLKIADEMQKSLLDVLG